MIRFTPGPWKAVLIAADFNDDKRWAIVTGKQDEIGLDEYVMAETGVEPKGSWCGVSMDDIPGNMKLAAKAPEMYEALKSACRYCASCNHTLCEHCKINLVIKELEAE